MREAAAVDVSANESLPVWLTELHPLRESLIALRPCVSGALTALGINEHPQQRRFPVVAAFAAQQEAAVVARDHPDVETWMLIVSKLPKSLVNAMSERIRLQVGLQTTS